MRFSWLPSCYRVLLHKTSSMKTPIFSTAYQPTLKLWWLFYCRNQLWPKIALISTAYPQVHFKSTQECHTLSEKNPERTNASSHRRWWCTSSDLRPFTRPILIGLLSITNLLFLSPNKLGMPIYLINGIAFPPLTSNSTKYCTHLMSPSDQLSSPMD